MTLTRWEPQQYVALDPAQANRNTHTAHTQRLSALPVPKGHTNAMGLGASNLAQFRSVCEVGGKVVAWGYFEVI